MTVADATPVCYLCGIAGGSRQPMTGRLATHPSNTTVKIDTRGLQDGNLVDI